LKIRATGFAGYPQNQNQRRRRGIFVDYIRKSSSSSVGAAYSDDAAPERSFWEINFASYKDFAPAVLADLRHALTSPAGFSAAVRLTP
jgi:hypothetical protein